MLFLGSHLHLLLFHFHLAPHHLFLLQSGLLSALQLLLFCLLLLPLLLSLALFFLNTLHLSPLLHLCFLGLPLGLSRRRSSCVRATIVLLLLSWLLFSLFAFTACSQQLSHVRRGIDTRRRCAEHLLEPNIRLVGLLASQHHTWLDIDLLLHDHFGE